MTKETLIKIFRIWKILYLSAKIALVFCLLQFFRAYQNQDKLPESHSLKGRLSSAPIQRATDTPSFNFEWRGKKYLIYPKADYFLEGLVVSHNNISGLGDIYHTSDSVDLKDICVVWGHSISEGLYQKATYWSEPWTCNFRMKEGGISLYADELSNNHLLAGTEAIAKSIKETRVGDQIELRGFLVDYASAESPGGVRKTSLVRDDTGDGACEVIFVTQYSIQKVANKEWREKFRFYRKSLLVLVGFIVFSFLGLAQMEYRLI